MRLLSLALFASLLPTLALADVDTILADAAKLCSEQDNGVFGSEGAVRQIDLTGDGKPDTLVDEGIFTCSTAASLFGGSGGSMIHILANDTQSSYLVQGYETTTWAGSLILLLAQHGSNCNATGVLPCFEALTWGEDSFLSVRPQTP